MVSDVPLHMVFPALSKIRLMALRLRISQRRIEIQFSLKDTSAFPLQLINCMIQQTPVIAVYT